MHKLEIDSFGAVEVQNDKRIKGFFRVIVDDAIILNRIMLLLEDDGTFSIEFPTACVECDYAFCGVSFAAEDNCLTEDAIEFGAALVTLAAEAYEEFLSQSD